MLLQAVVVRAGVVVRVIQRWAVLVMNIIQFVLIKHRLPVRAVIRI